MTEDRNIFIKYYHGTLSSLKNEDLRTTARKILHVLLKPLHHQNIMYHKDLTTSDLSYKDNLEFAFGSEEHIDKNYTDFFNTKKSAIRKLQQGHLLFLVRQEGKNLCYSWIERKKADIPVLRAAGIVLPQDVVYMASQYVPRKYAGRRLSIRNLKFIERYLWEAFDIRKVFAITAPKNRVANAVLKIAGYTAYQHVLLINIPVFKLYIVTSMNENMSRKRRIFVRGTKFWNCFSALLGGDRSSK